MPHYYKANGETQYTIKGSNGKQRDTTLRDARKLNLYPSVTEVKGAILRNDFLDGWLREQLAIWAYENRPIQDETKEEYVSRAIQGGNAKGRKAADFGTIFHDTAERYAADRSIKIPFEVFEFWGPFKEWFDENVIEVIATELRTTAVQFGIGGSIDLICILKDVGLAIVDFKTQGVKSREYKTEPFIRKVPAYYDGWIQQLAMYAAMYELHQVSDDKKDEVAQGFINGVWSDSAPKCVSVVIDSIEAGFVEMKVWEDEKRNHALQLGLSCMKTWTLAKKHTPKGFIL